MDHVLRRRAPFDRHAGVGRVRDVRPPGDCGIATLYPGADLVDAFAVVLPGPGPHDIGALAELALARPPAWLRLAMGTRDAVVARLGLKTSDGIRARLLGQGHDRVDFFPVLARSEREMILGENDRHLDFRLSLLIRPSPGTAADELVATTLVRCHNRLGRAYLAAIGPSHRLVVRSSLRVAASAPSGDRTPADARPRR